MNPNTPFSHPAVLFFDLFLVNSILIGVGAIIGFLLTRKAREEQGKEEHPPVIPPTAMTGEPPMAAGEVGD